MSQPGRHSIRVPLRIRTPKDREKIESTVESLIAILDKEDGDCDLEPSLADNGGYGIPTGHDLEFDSADDEPELGWTGDVDQVRAQHGLVQAQEFNHSEAEHDGREPSLGSSNFEVDQTHWASGSNSRDLEADYVGRPDGFNSVGLTADMEPGADREQECEDEGAEHDGREPRSAPFELVQERAP